MEEVSNFFRCCRSNTNEAQVLVTMREKPRGSQNSTPTKKTFIKRSVGKSSISDLEGKNSNHTTLRTLRASSHTRDNRKKGLELSPQTHESFDTSGDNFQRVSIGHQQWGWPLNSQDFSSTRQQLQKFINYYQYNSANNSFDSLLNSNQQLFQLHEQPRFKVTVPRLLTNQKAYRQDNSNSYGSNIYWRQGAPVLKTILQTIDEKSSVPSMQESQAYQLRQISSRATLKSNILDKRHQSPSTEKFESMMIMNSHSRQSLRLANSQNLPSPIPYDKEEKDNQKSSNRLSMNNQLLLRELRTLEEQERMLLRQKEFNNIKFQNQINALQAANMGYKEKITKREQELFELSGLLKQIRR